MISLAVALNLAQENITPSTKGDKRLIHESVVTELWGGGYGTATAQHPGPGACTCCTLSNTCVNEFPHESDWQMTDM